LIIATLPITQNCPKNTLFATVNSTLDANSSDGNIPLPLKSFLKDQFYPHSFGLSDPDPLVHHPKNTVLGFHGWDKIVP